MAATTETTTAPELGRNVLRRVDARRVEDAVLERRSRIVAGDLTMRQAAEEIGAELGLAVTPANVRSAALAVDISFPGRSPAASGPTVRERIGELEDLIQVLGLRLERALGEIDGRVERLDAIELEVRRLRLRLDELWAASRLDSDLFPQGAPQAPQTDAAEAATPEPSNGTPAG